MDERIKNKKYSYSIQSSKGKSINLFIKDNENFKNEVWDTSNILETKKLSEIDYHILLGASECFTELKFNILKKKKSESS